MGLLTRLFRDLHLVFTQEPMLGIPICAPALARRMVAVNVSGASPHDLVGPQTPGNRLRIEKIVLVQDGAAKLKFQKSPDGTTGWTDLSGPMALGGNSGPELDHELAPIELAADEHFGISIDQAVGVGGYLMVSEVPSS